MKFWKRVFKNSIDKDSKHHIQSALVVIALVAFLIWVSVQLSQVTSNFHLIKDLEQENILLEDNLTITNNELNSLRIKLDRLLIRFENEQEYITINLEDVLREIDYKYIQYDIKLDGLSHEECESKIQELRGEVEHLRKMVK